MLRASKIIQMEVFTGVFNETLRSVSISKRLRLISHTLENALSMRQQAFATNFWSALNCIIQCM